MTTKAILQERADALEKELKGLREEISAMPDDKWVPKWVPNYGDRYWFVTSLGLSDAWPWAGADIDKDRLAFNNVFPTKEKAEQARDVIKGMCWEEFPEKNAVVEWVHEGKHRIDYWQGFPSQKAMFRMGTLRVKK